ncbi:MAG: GTPase HflX [Exilispira sp.]
MKAILISVLKNQNFILEDAIEKDNEMRLLCQSAGIEILNKEKIIIKYKDIDAKTFFTKGKLEQIKNSIDRCNINKAENEIVIVINMDFSPTQIRNCEKFFGKSIITKTQLIYQIFLTRANSKPAKIQLELANLKYLKSKLAGSYQNFDRIRGGIGLKGPGETKLEVDRRSISKKIKKLEQQLEKIEKNLVLHIKNRENQFIFSLVGYTNAGKTSLLNILTKSNQYAENLLFSTVNVKSRQLYLKSDKKIIVTDTIGFIRDLPVHLVESFKTTLLEIRYSSLIGIVVDSSSSNYKEHIEIVLSMLKDLNVENINTIIIFNKIDLLSNEEFIQLKIKNSIDFKDSNMPIFYLSARTKYGLENLLNYLKFIS